MMKVSIVIVSCMTAAVRLSKRHEIAEHFPSQKGFRFPREVVAYAD